MATHLVNLDALIPREDFDALSSKPTQRSMGTELKVTELAGSYYNLLRKPDFQRETANWEPEKIVDFIQSFLNGDLIPAPIMWWSDDGGLDFVIDGAHRLSAILAWVYDDYGDGEISRLFFGFKIPEQQMRLALRTRRLVDERVGAYSRLMYVAEKGIADDQELLVRARTTIAAKFDIQRVRGEAAAAEHSFFKINMGASAIDSTELGVLMARRKPNAIATRALMRSGTGHKYWVKFAPNVKSEIEGLAQEISADLFTPRLDEEARTTDWPVAGQPYSHTAFKTILDLVNQVNGVTANMWLPAKGGAKRKNLDAVLPDDADGLATLEYLRRVRSETAWISGNEPRSLGLHPMVYFYNSVGNFQPVAYLAAIQFVKELRDRRRLDSFTQHRRGFEEFLLRHRYFVSQLVHAYGSRTRSLEPLVTLYRVLLESLESGLSDDASVIDRLRKEERLHALKDQDDSKNVPRRKKFSAEVKRETLVRKVLESPMRCEICDARLSPRSMTLDHKKRIQDGGLGDAENAQTTHPYCNSGYKERQAHLERLAAAKATAEPFAPSSLSPLTDSTVRAVP